MTIASRAVVTSRFGHKVAVWNYLMTTVCRAASYLQAERGKIICQKTHREATHISIFSIFTFLHLFLYLPHLYLNVNLDTQLQTPLTKEKGTKGESLLPLVSRQQIYFMYRLLLYF